MTPMVNNLADQMAAKYPEAAAMDRQELCTIIAALLEDAQKLEVVALEDVERLVEIRFWLDPEHAGAGIPFVVAALIANTNVPAKARLDMIDTHVRHRKARS